MTYKINTTNQPIGADLIEVDDTEFIDLQRQGLIRPDAGDVNSDGVLKSSVAKKAPVEVQQAVPSAQTGAQPTVQGGQN